MTSPTEKSFFFQTRFASNNIEFLPETKNLLFELIALIPQLKMGPTNFCCQPRVTADNHKLLLPTTKRFWQTAAPSGPDNRKCLIVVYKRDDWTKFFDRSFSFCSSWWGCGTGTCLSQVHWYARSAVRFSVTPVPLHCMHLVNTIASMSSQFPTPFAYLTFKYYTIFRSTCPDAS